MVKMNYYTAACNYRISVAILYVLYGNSYIILFRILCYSLILYQLSVKIIHAISTSHYILTAQNLSHNEYHLSYTHNCTCPSSKTTFSHILIHLDYTFLLFLMLVYIFPFQMDHKTSSAPYFP